MHVLAMGRIGIRLYARILTGEASHPQDLADHVVDEINCYLPQALPSEQQMLFQLACEIHDIFTDAFERVDDLAVRHEAIELVNELLSQTREFPGTGG
ncbi:hypothetical protein N8I74_04925 [Chitiniphilus purpureus]|uniref:Uncharacterized protein n=1 Tax=Chitiniphilus purpureus TaxID=2981137 RepID=A0ABY6DPT9_9NEIS|nr:hypothetical protein [Chitiniphilus sp. CD1]UXY16366.1 hypothetical protein N8I74_04925 [Chitiniphilus sp. CD1]